jgi:hypothetical protein
MVVVVVVVMALLMMMIVMIASRDNLQCSIGFEAHWVSDVHHFHSLICQR